MNLPLDRQFLEAQPGHCVRRLHQIAVALFMDETAGSGVTPVQFAAMTAVHDQPGLDQRTLAASIAFDTSTIGGVIDRLERRGLIQRNHAPHDRRVRLLTLTPEGEQLLQAVLPAVQAAQHQIVAPLPVADRERFLDMLRTLVEAHEDVPGSREAG